MKQRFIALVLLFAIAASFAAGCAQNPPLPDDTSNDASIPEAEVPAPAYNFDGAQYTILCRTDFSYEFLPEDRTADIISDAVYNRNAAVEADYNVFLNPIAIPGAWGIRIHSWRPFRKMYRQATILISSLRATTPTSLH